MTDLLATCACCARAFTARRVTARYCSERCKKRAQRQLALQLAGQIGRGLSNCLSPVVPHPEASWGPYSGRKRQAEDAWIPHGVSDADLKVLVRERVAAGLLKASDVADSLLRDDPPVPVVDMTRAMDPAKFPITITPATGCEDVDLPAYLDRRPKLKEVA